MYAKIQSIFYEEHVVLYWLKPGHVMYRHLIARNVGV